MMQAPGKLNEKNRRLLRRSIFIAIGMFGFCYVLVPIYNVMCKQLGINGKTNKVAVAKYTKPVDKTRIITLQFLATNNEEMPWKFHPNQTEIKIHPGENNRVSYFAENPTDHTMVIQAIPSVTPGVAAKYLQKTECFCFTQQTFKAGEKMDMPIQFYIDPDLPKNITTITLSYTIFDITKRMRKNA